MDHRPLGRTGVSVSKLCLGAMMFGDWGNTDHDECDPDHPPRARRGDQLHRHRRRLLARRVRGDRRQGAGRDKRDDVVLATKVHMPMGDGPQPARQLAPVDHARGRELAAAAGDRLDRPLPDPPPRPRHRHRRDARRPDRSGPRRARSATSATRPSRRRRSSRRSGRRGSAAASDSSASSRPTRMLVRGIEADVLPTCQRYGMGVIPCSPLAGGWLSGRYRKGCQAQGPTSPVRATTGRPLRPVAAGQPAQAGRR